MLTHLASTYATASASLFQADVFQVAVIFPLCTTGSLGDHIQLLSMLFLQICSSHPCQTLDPRNDTNNALKEFVENPVSSEFAQLTDQI
jgi:hypothetical protein